MSQNDPTDHALAVIASIFDQKETPETKTAEREVEHHAAVTIITETTVTETVVTETVFAEDATHHGANPSIDMAVDEHDSPATAPEQAEVEGYSRLGPGPLDAIRFRWTARRNDDGQYFVDETVGGNSRAITSGPMPRDEVVLFIDSRERAARERFDKLKREMTFGHHARADDGPDDT